MNNRLLRVNALLQRELSGILHRRYQAETVTLTITEVRVAPDLRTARVYVSIVGSEEHIQGRLRWLSRQAGEIRHELSRRIVLKYLPRLDYVLDAAAERGTRIVQLLDELAASDGSSLGDGAPIEGARRDAAREYGYVTDAPTRSTRADDEAEDDDDADDASRAGGFGGFTTDAAEAADASDFDDAGEGEGRGEEHRSDD